MTPVIPLQLTGVFLLDFKMEACLLLIDFCCRLWLPNVKIKK